MFALHFVVKSMNSQASLKGLGSLNCPGGKESLWTLAECIVVQALCKWPGRLPPSETLPLLRNCVPWMWLMAWACKLDAFRSKWLAFPITPPLSNLFPDEQLKIKSRAFSYNARCEQAEPQLEASGVLFSQGLL